MPLLKDKEEKIISIQTRIIRKSLRKNGEFNEEIKTISSEDRTEFNKLYDELQQDSITNNDEVLKAKLVLWKEFFSKIEEFCQEKNVFKKLEKIVYINEPTIVKAFTKYAKNISLMEVSKVEKLFTFCFQESNIGMIEWLVTNKSVLDLYEPKLEKKKRKSSSKNEFNWLKPSIPVVTKNFLQAVKANKIDVAQFLLDKKYVRLSVETDVNNQIMIAVLKTDNKQLIETMIKKNFLEKEEDVFLNDKFNYLKTFILNNKPEVVAKLFDNGLPVDFTVNLWDGETFLVSAVKASNEKIVQLLVAKGTNLDTVHNFVIGGETYKKMTILALAIQSKNIKMANLLIDLEPKIVTYASSNNITPLILAIIEGEKNLVAKILAVESAFKKEDKTLYRAESDTGFTPLMYAIKEKNVVIIKKLLATDPTLVNEEVILGKKKLSPLMVAIDPKVLDYEVIDILLKNGAKVNYHNPNEDFPTPFFRALALNDLKLMEKLKSYGADINFISYNKGKYMTPLTCGINTSTIVTPTLLFFTKYNINLNSFNSEGHTLLTLASKNGDSYFINKILHEFHNLELDVNYPDKDGNTALHWAIKTGNVKLVEILIIKHGAKRDIVNNEGVSPLDLAQEQANERIKQIVFNNASEKILPSPLVSLPKLEPLSVPEVFEVNRINDSPARNYTKKRKSGSAPKTSFLVINNFKKDSFSKEQQRLETKQLEVTLKNPSSANKTNPVRSTCSKHQPDAEKIIKSLNYMAKKEVQDRLWAEEQKRRKTEQKEKGAVNVLESEEQNISNLEQSENNKEYYQFIAKLREKLAANIDNDFYVVKRANGKDHEGGRPAIKIYESKGNKNKQILFGFFSSIKEEKKPAHSLTFSLENDRDSYLYEINWADKNEVIGKWKILNVENKVQSKVTTAHKVEIANLVALEHLQTIFATEFIDFNHKQTKTKFEQINFKATTSGAIAQPVNTEQVSIPDCLSSTYFSVKNDNDFYYKKVKNDKYSVEKPLDVVEVNVYQEQKNQPSNLTTNVMSKHLTP